MQDENNAGTSMSGLKALGREALDLGARYLDAGREWLNDRRNEMKNQYEQGAHRRDDRDLSREGRYHGTDYDDPRAQHASRQGDVFSGQRYGRSHSESGGSRQSMDDRYDDTGSRGQRFDDEPQAGRYGGYAADDGQGRWPASAGRGFAEEQYGSGRRHDAQGARQQGMGPQDPRGNVYGQQGGYGGQRGFEQSDFGPGYGQGRQRMSGDGPGNDDGQNGYAQSGYGQSGYGQSGHGQRGYGASQGNYGQGSYGQGSYGQDNYGQSGYGQSEDRGASQGGVGMGSHRGKGPRNYSRSDERITEDLNERLMQDDEIDASDIDVKVANGEVTLEGTVTQRAMKHRIEDLAEACSGVKDVENRIRVKRDDQSGDQSASGKKAGGTPSAASGQSGASSSGAQPSGGTTSQKSGSGRSTT